MARPKNLGPYAPLSATYFLDDSILEAGPDAEVLYTRSLAFCSDSGSDGFITDRQVSSVIGIGLPRLTRRVESLLTVDLWQRVDGGYVVRAWLKWNRSAEEIGRARKNDRERKSSQRGLFGNGDS